MKGKILRRCSLCQNFHAIYRVEDARLGVLYLCKECWDAKVKPGLAAQAPIEGAEPGSNVGGSADGG